jgi:hypothetical protein
MLALSVAILFGLAGMVLGQHFKATLLAPITVIVFACAMAAAVIRGQLCCTIWLTTTLAIFALQLGYLMGLKDAILKFSRLALQA